jgi:hypothetical protein
MNERDIDALTEIVMGMTFGEVARLARNSEQLLALSRAMERAARTRITDEASKRDRLLAGENPQA